jgi:16S rRNA (adenine1518-N6/adenine1519-N6)-dimethyltransferase
MKVKKIAPTKSALNKHGLAPSKKRGQNFLVNPRTAETIVKLAEFSPEEKVIEVGVGLGALTLPLARKVHQVIGLELDKGIIRYHQKEQILPENVQLIHGDILEADFSRFAKQIGAELKIIANLPYSISNQFIFKIIENKKYIEQVTVMLQKEVADRLSARPNCKEYGIPTILLGSCAQIIKLMTLKPAEFHPRPKIDSVVLRILFNKKQDDSYRFSHFQKIVRTAFSNRRKTLCNNLASPLIFSEQASTTRVDLKKLAAEVINRAGLHPGIRAEALSIEDFQRLTKTFEEYRFG